MVFSLCSYFSSSSKYETSSPCESPPPPENPPDEEDEKKVDEKIEMTANPLRYSGKKGSQIFPNAVKDLKLPAEDYLDLNNYENIQEIQHDNGYTSSSVFSAVHEQSKEEFILKRLEEASIREYDLIQLVNHKNFVKAYALICDGADTYILYEKGITDFFDYIDRNHPLSEEGIYYFFTQIVNAIEHLHNNRIVHRDIKPDNIIVFEKNILKLGDLGFAKQIDGDGDHTPRGTVMYTAPEVIDIKMISGKRSYGFAADFWSLGVLLYAMSYCENPFDDVNNSNQTIHNVLYKQVEFPESSESLPKGRSSSLVDLMQKLMEKNPKKRITTFEALRSHPWVKGRSLASILNL